MKRVRVADEAGACYGVERALTMAEQAARTAADKPVHTLGPLIHNPRVVSDLADAGVVVAQSPEQAEGFTLLLRTHGTAPEEEQRARTLCSSVLDATCPFVHKVHSAARRLAHEGYQVIVVGEAGHPEVEATLPHAPGSVVVGSVEEAQRLGHLSRVGVVVQTTARVALLKAVVAQLAEQAEEVRVINTICGATSGHQASCERLAQEVEVMVVVGGRISANTTRLAEIAAQHCPRTHHIEGADELDASWFDGVDEVGVTAGASTPASHIDAVCARIRELIGLDAAE